MEKVAAATSRKTGRRGGVLKEALSADPGNANYHNLTRFAAQGANPT
jgi:hypothetical protein